MAEVRGAFGAPLLLAAVVSGAVTCVGVVGLPDSARAQEEVAAADSPPPALSALSALHPDTVFRIPGGPRVVLLGAPGSPVVALRLLVPLVEGPVEAGSARVLQEIRLADLRSPARQVGARIEASRTRRGLAYSVSGAAPDFDYLAWLLRRAVADPRPGEGEVERAVQVVRAGAEESAETAEGRLRARLRSRVWPDQPPDLGTPPALERVNPASVRDFWSRTHQAREMTLVVVGEVDPVVVLANFQGIGAPAAARAGPLEASAAEVEPGEVQILRSWFGQAYVVEDATDPRPAVAAALMARRLEETELRLEGTVELWEAGAVSAIIVMAAAYREGADGMRRAVRGLPGNTADALDTEGLRRTVARLRADLLLGARTPRSLAALVGHFADGTGDPMGAEAFLEALGRVEVDGMRAFLEELQARTSIREELRP